MADTEIAAKAEGTGDCSPLAKAKWQYGGRESYEMQQQCGM
jgi:hypothetical protein